MKKILKTELHAKSAKWLQEVLAEEKAADLTYYGKSVAVLVDVAYFNYLIEQTHAYNMLLASMLDTD